MHLHARHRDDVVQAALELLEEVVHGVLDALLEGVAGVHLHLLVLEVEVIADALLLDHLAAERRQLPGEAGAPRLAADALHEGPGCSTLRRVLEQEMVPM